MIAKIKMKKGMLMFCSKNKRCMFFLVSNCKFENGTPEKHCDTFIIYPFIKFGELWEDSWYYKNGIFYHNGKLIKGVSNEE